MATFDRRRLFGNLASATLLQGVRREFVQGHADRKGAMTGQPDGRTRPADLRRLSRLKRRKGPGRDIGQISAAPTLFVQQVMSGSERE